MWVLNLPPGLLTAPRGLCNVEITSFWERSPPAALSSESPTMKRRKIRSVSHSVPSTFHTGPVVEQHDCSDDSGSTAPCPACCRPETD